MAFFFLLFISRTFAQDLDTGYKFGTVKPPDSPIQNTWSAFHTDLFTGSFGYEYKIEVPPGVNGLAPEVKLSYNSHSASGKAGWVGAGWDVPLNYIQRDIEYTRKDTSDDTFDLFLSGAKHDLVYVPSETRYHTQIETYHRIEKLTGAANDSGEYWLVTTKDGTQYRFGYNLDSEHRVNATDGNVPRYVWRWSLDQIQDTNGNKIYFSYTEDRGAVYLRQIAYNNDQERRVDFVLEASDRPDNYLMIDQGSEVRIARRLREIRVVVRNGLAWKYLLDYTLNDAQTKSLLTTITQYGADNVTALPPVRFDYHAMNASFSPETSWATPGERYIRKVDGVDTVVDTFDANGDGLPDLVSYDTNDYPHWDIWFNTRSGFATANVKWAVPDGWMIRDVIPLLLDDDQSDGGDSPDTRTSPMDINRDGYIDFLQAHSERERVLSIRLNNGSGFSSAVAWSLPTLASIQEVQLPDGVAPNVKQEFFDINGDGLPDLVKRENSETAWHVWRNTGNGFVDFGVWPVPNPKAWVWDTTRGEDNLQVGHYDMNGDGLQDIVNGHHSDWWVHFNTGSDFLPQEVWPTGYSGGLIRDADTTGNVTRDLFDINGDDLPDNIDPGSGTDVWQVRLNNGHGFGPVIAWATNSARTDGYSRDVTKDGNVARDTLDMDGDGLVDLVRKTDTDWKVYFNRAGQADLLTQITDTLGGKVEITYGPSMVYPQQQQIYPPPYPASRLPFNFWVVTAVTKDNGMSGAHAVRATMSYHYMGGQYDFPSREFRGFGAVEEYRPNLSRKGINFWQYDNCLKGKQLRNDIRWTDVQQYRYFTLDNNFSCSIEHDNVYNSQIIDTYETTSEVRSSVYRTKRTGFEYDNYGNVILETRYGDLSLTGDEAYIYRSFSPNPTKWIVDRLSQQTVKGPTTNSPILRQAFYSYDTAGNLINERRVIGAGSEAVTTYQYDSYGNRIRTTDPEGRTTQVEYDSVFHTFPARTTNAKGQVIQRTYNPVNGKIEQEIDPNGYSTRYVYDTFQRQIKAIRPYDSEALPTTETEYALDGVAPERVTVRKRDVVSGQPGTLDTVQAVDGFGKLIQTRSGAEQPGQEIVKDVFYDLLDRIARQSNPYFSSASGDYQTPNTAAPATRYEYDGLDRPVRITNPDGSQINRQFYLWTVTETDENGHAKVYDFDAFQRLIQVQEQNAGQTYTTHYTYDSVGQLTDVTDHLGNNTQIQYDLLGRKTWMSDPDLGQWEYSYDRVGNLIAQTDARGVTTQFQYDPLNRQTLINYPHDPDVQLRYDLTTIGTLSEVVDALGDVSFNYDQRLRKTRETRRMDGLEWTTQWIYDALDRVTGETRPDGSIVWYDYNPQGLLDSILPHVNDLDYNANGQVTTKVLANGLISSYTYHPQNNRLTSISTPILQDLSYQYDAVGNVTSIQDDVAGKTESFGYDDLDRLTSAGDGDYSHQYQYNAIGNLTSAVEDGAALTYQYGQGAGPHAVTSLTRPDPITYALTVTKAGTGTGTVTGTGINCGSDCSETYASGTVVTLTATATAGSTFAGWSGACIGTATTCTVTMNAAKSTTATFNASMSGALRVAGLTSTGKIYYTLNLSTWINIPGQLSQLEVGDLNHDGQSDLVGLTSAGQIYYTTNRASWTHLPGVLAQLTVGDFNGDGQDDLAGLTSAGQIFYTTNRATWTNIPGQLNRLVVGDFNHDGQDDLAGLTSAGQIFYTTNRATWTNIPGQLNRLVAGDFNHDGQDDLAGLTSAGQIFYTINRATWANIPGQLNRLVAGDFNHDGWDDLAGLASTGQIFYTTNRTTWINIPGQLNRLVARDLNSDGQDDLAGLTSAGQIFYTTNRATWINIPGRLDRLAGDN